MMKQFNDKKKIPIEIVPKDEKKCSKTKKHNFPSNVN